MTVSDSVLASGWRPIVFVTILAIALVDPIGVFEGPSLAQEGGNTGTNPPEAGSGGGNTTNNESEATDPKYQPIIQALTMVFILAVLIEVGLAVVFKWRLFLRKLDSRGWKVPIAFAVSYLIVRYHQIDLPEIVVGALGDTSGGRSEAGYAVSALIVAGGSSSVNGIFERLGWRNPLAQQQKAQAEQEKDIGRIFVNVTRTPSSGGAQQPLTVAIDGKAIGTIPPNETLFGAPRGHDVASGSHTIKISWTDPNGNPGAVESVATVAGQAKVTVELALT